MLISVIIPVYNAEKYLRECIDSIVNQSYKNLEIILVNDGSTDNSALICEEYKNKDNRIRVFHIENSGTSVARNFGISVSNGNLITFVDSDDYIDKNLCEEMLYLFELNDIDIAFGEMSIFCGDKFSIKNKLENGIYSREEMIQKILTSQIPISVCGKFFKRDLFKKQEIFPIGKIGEDHRGLFELIKNSKKINTINKPFYFYRQENANSITKDIITDKILNIFEIKEDIIAEINTEFGEKYSNFIDAYIIPTAIYTKGRLVSEVNELSNDSIKIINDYYDKYKFKALFNKYVEKNIKISAVLLMLGLYKIFKDFKNRKR